MKKINITLELEAEQINNFEYWLRQNVNVIDFKIMPDTKDIYENDETYRNLCKSVKKAQEIRDKYYNEKR
jgi:hypothetical protein